jgi:hypothetical protein
LYGFTLPFIWLGRLVCKSISKDRLNSLIELRNSGVIKSLLSAWLVIPLVLTVGAVWAHLALSDNRLPHYAILRREPPSGSVGHYLKAETSILPGSRFRGSVALRHDVGNDSNLDMMEDWDITRVPNSPAMDLWTKDIPTYTEYSPMVTPQAYFLMSRLASDEPDQFRNGMPYPGIDALSLKMLQALGVRFFITQVPIETQDVQLRRRFKSRIGKDTFVYELSDPNRDGFSPTRVHVERVAEKYLALLAADDFQFRRDVVLTESIDGTLVPAQESQLYFTSKGPRIVASSKGKSLIVLPIQYSHCLAFRGPTNARLLRANLIQVGLLFDSNIDVTFEFQTGPLLNPLCRKADLQEAKDLQIKPDGKVPPPPPEIYRPYIGKPILPFLESYLPILVR